MEKPRDKETTLQNLLLHSRPGPEQRSSGSPPSPAHGANAGIAALRDSRDDTHTTSCIPPVRSPVSAQKSHTQRTTSTHPSITICNIHPIQNTTTHLYPHSMPPRLLTRAGSTCSSLPATFLPSPAHGTDPGLQHALSPSPPKIE